MEDFEFDPLSWLTPFGWFMVYLGHFAVFSAMAYRTSGRFRLRDIFDDIGSVLVFLAAPFVTTPIWVGLLLLLEAMVEFPCRN